MQCCPEPVFSQGHISTCGLQGLPPNARLHAGLLATSGHRAATLVSCIVSPNCCNSCPCPSCPFALGPTWLSGLKVFGCEDDSFLIAMVSAAPCKQAAWWLFPGLSYS